MENDVLIKQQDFHFLQSTSRKIGIRNLCQSGGLISEMKVLLFDDCTKNCHFDILFSFIHRRIQLWIYRSLEAGMSHVMRPYFTHGTAAHRITHGRRQTRTRGLIS
jgi:hypothetical protein